MRASHELLMAKLPIAAVTSFRIVGRENSKNVCSVSIQLTAIPMGMPFHVGSLVPHNRHDVGVVMVDEPILVSHSYTILVYATQWWLVESADTVIPMSSTSMRG